MNKWVVTLVCLLLWSINVYSQKNRKLFFLKLSQLEFADARSNAIIEKDSLMRFEMLQLADLLFSEGQKEISHFKLTVSDSSSDSELLCLRALNKGFFYLFYDLVKGNAYKHFYKAYELAIKSENVVLIKASLLAFFKYYNLEIAQISDSYKAHLDHFESLKADYFDEIWLTIYKLIFYSKLNATEPQYFRLVQLLNEYEKRINPTSPVLAYVFFEQAIAYEVAGDILNEKSVEYFKKVIKQAEDYPFLQDKKFNSLIKLVNIETSRKNFLNAEQYLVKARREINLSDTLRSNYYINIYSSFLNHAIGKNDSAFLYLKKAFVQDFYLGYKRNNLEMNRLNVELKTQEKENVNLQLRQNRTWLTAGLVGVALLFLVSYFAYANQRSKNRIQAKEKEVQAMKLEKVLKDQEILGIDAMIEGQEKERQRIASELHDNLGSLLATIKLHFHHIKVNMEGNEAVQTGMLQKTEDLLSEVYQKVRGMAHAGNVGVNAKDGLLPAVKKFASKVSISNELKIEVKEHGMDQRLENSLEIIVFRMIQELIANVIKHAQATEVVINLTHYDQSINLMVEDNGIGFDINQIKPQETMGLHSIQKRMESLGGSVTVDSIPHKGTTIIIDIPIV